MMKNRKKRFSRNKAHQCFCVRVASLFFPFAFSLPLFAHDGKPHNFAELLSTWSFDPLIVVGLIFSAWIYYKGVFRLWRAASHRRSIKMWETFAFAGGWLSLFVALVSPLHPWGEVLFSAHMTQHEILMLIAAPLFVLSRSLIAMLWALPRSFGRQTTNLLKTNLIEKIRYFITNPFVAWAIHAVALWVWHIPSLFQATLNSDIIHTLQHTSFFLSALLFWWAIIYTPRGITGYGAGVLYLFTTMIHSGLLGAFFTFTNRIWYPAYEKSTVTWGLSPLEDQQLGGLIMWVPAGLIYIIAGLIMFAGWLKDSEQRVLAREKQIFAAEMKQEFSR